ncbi:MAG: hypothetical protein LBR80_06245 [Deltaproteobacteria bacterium]|jgi:intracellular multiplication protein IcmO|nr:hypothetical protein [Deltaproteobacteria bacterium]
MSREALMAAFLSCNFEPGDGDSKGHSFNEQFGYAQSYFGKALSSLTDTYGRIYGAESGVEDFRDIVLNRRILLALLPLHGEEPGGARRAR